ncbi:hypothetical protein [Sorangium cellulosum]|uniref:hypothetical protein n=1 Tax=Sorangium cellulosum TaxID=56 RepID=UPI001331B67F|nr:hypothetical protein [Sorangium cellulosum]
MNDPLNLRDPTGFEPCNGENCTPVTPVTIAPPPGVAIDGEGTGTKEVNVFEDGAELLPEDDGSIEGSGSEGGAGPGGGLGGGEGGASSEADRGEAGIGIVGPPLTEADVRQLAHLCLDACGFAPPPIGPTCDVANACFYLVEGDGVNAGMSLWAAAPGVGDASKLYSSVKGAGQVGKAARMARDAAAPRPARGASQLTPGVRGFASEAHLERHFARHASEWGAGNITKMGYAKRAETLLRSPVGGDIQGFTSKRGWTFRYNSQTNEFATMKPDGTIETLFRPRDGARYWAEQVGRYGP